MKSQLKCFQEREVNVAPNHIYTHIWVKRGNISWYLNGKSWVLHTCFFSDLQHSTHIQEAGEADLVVLVRLPVHTVCVTCVCLSDII